MDLNKLGWNTFFEKYSESYQNEDVFIGRVFSEHKNSYIIFSCQGELTATISGKLRNNSKNKEDFPAVGDWVAFNFIQNESKAIIQSVLPRKSKFSRKVVGKKSEEQIIATNIDTAFIVCGLNYDFNLRRIERYLSLVWQSGANPVIVLTKSDLCGDIETKLTEVESIAFGINIHFIDNLSKKGIEELKPYHQQGKTIVLLGSSGVGKSSLINNLLEDNKMQINDLRKNIEKGQHTTTHKQMFILPEGGLIIDTPGMRELQIWEVENGLDCYFYDIKTIVQHCRFNNCKHQNEPECAVKKAIEDGVLDIKRFKNYSKLLKEQEYVINSKTENAAQLERRKWKNIHKEIKKKYKNNN